MDINFNHKVFKCHIDAAIAHATSDLTILSKDKSWAHGISE
jgi:hypothetical protein